MGKNMDKRVLGVVAVAAGGLVATDAGAAVIIKSGATLPNGGVVSGTQTINIDFDANGTSDVAVANNNNKNAGGYYLVQPANRDTSVVQQAFTTPNGTATTRYTPLVLGNTVGMNSNFSNGISQGDDNRLAGAEDSDTNRGLFPKDGTERYFGVAFTDASGSIYFGYAGVKLTAAGNADTSKATITGYAYESTPFTDIRVVPVPEPVSLSALALGGLGLLARRRQVA